MMFNSENLITSLFVSCIVSVGSAVIWLVRRVFTNQKQLELLQQEMAHREKSREEDRQLIRDTRNDVTEIGRRIDDWISRK